MNKIAKVLALLITSLFLAFGLVNSASAHTDVTSTAPTADATVDAPLKEISVTLGEAPLLEGSAITVVNQDGSPVETEAAKLSGSKLYIPWPADIAVGDVTVNFRIATNDGHVVDDSFSFTYTAAAVAEAASADPSALPTDSVTAMPTDMPTVMVTGLPLATGDDDADALGEEAEGKTWILVGVIAFVVIASGLLFMRRKK